MNFVHLDRPGDRVALTIAAADCRNQEPAEQERKQWAKQFTSSTLPARVGSHRPQCCSQSATVKAILGSNTKRPSHPDWLFPPRVCQSFRLMPGYSGTPLPQKLGIKPGTIVVLIDAPDNYRKLLGDIPSGVNFATRPTGNSRFLHLFTAERHVLEKSLSSLRQKIPDDAVLWVSWPKKSSGVPTNVTEDVIRAVALPLGFVDVKVCAVDEVWSGLKLMIRREQRKGA